MTFSARCRATEWMLSTLAVMAGLGGCEPVQDREPAFAPAILVHPADDYVSSRACRACHLDHYRTWSQSYHEGMTQRPSVEGVFGEFDDIQLKTVSQTFELQRRGPRFSVEIRDTDADKPVLDPGAVPTGKHEIELVTGSHHMQFYWYASAAGDALIPLPFAYLRDAARWVPRRMVFLQPPRAFESPEAERWNTTCIHCHTTRAEPRPKDQGGFESQVADLGIACEACHGPGADHVAKFASPLARYQRYLGSPQATEIVNPLDLDHERASQICSQCHALWQFDQAGYERWSKRGLAYRPGDDPAQTMWLLAPSRSDEDPRVRAVMQRAKTYVAGQYWSDGQARVSGREYHGMSDSACFTRGELSCMSCHRMHEDPADPRSSAEWANDQLSPGMEGDGACIQCHAPIAAQGADHTKHSPQSSGSRCQNCHMPYTSYGLLKAIRSHQITIPSAEETLETGRPNACNLCHLDRTLAWTDEALQRLYGVSPAPSLGEHDRSVSLAARLALSGDAGQRVLMAWALGWPAARQTAGDAWMPPLLGVLMDDPYDAVRYVAHRALQAYSGYEQLEYDFVQPPPQRPAAAPRVAERAREALQGMPESVPLETDGTLGPLGAQLLSDRDNSRVRLLE